MDRRAALKKMVVGGATVVGASTVMSSVAFANPGTANCAASGTVTLAYATAGNSVTLTATVSASCVSECTTTPASITYTWGGDATGSGNVGTISMPNSGPYPYTRLWSLTVTVRCRDRNNELVCSTFSASGTVTKTASGNSYTWSPPTPPSGSLAYSPAPCT